MATKAKSISAEDLSKLTKAAVKAATVGVPGKFVSKGPTIGYQLQKQLPSSAELKLATEITKSLAGNANAVGISGLQAKPVVVARPGMPGTVTVGFLADELNINVIVKA